MADLISPDLLEILVCPEDRTPLSLAPTEQIQQLNAAIKAGKITNKGGAAVTDPVQGGLVRADNQILYPVRDWPQLLIDEGIPLSQLG